MKHSRWMSLGMAALLGAPVLVAAQAPAAGAPTAAPAAAAASAPVKPMQPAVCNNCHKPLADHVAGYFDNVAFKSQSIQLNQGGSTEIVRFDPKAVKVTLGGDDKPVEQLREIKQGLESRIAYTVRNGEKWAQSIAFKGPITTPPELRVDFETVARLVAQGPERGAYTLIDSRPLPRFQEGTIPTAINLPYPMFDKLTDRLPADKNRLTIFFCQGVTCMMSPLSMRKAKALGYTNLKVYAEGVPEWQTRDYLVTKPAFVKEAYVDKGIPVVLLDVRSPGEAASAHLAGAVGMPAATVGAKARSFPDPKLAAPIVVYDGRGTETAIAAARKLIAAGQTNVQVLDGGLLAWQRSGYPVASDSPAATRIAYVPKPRPGSIPADEFRKLASAIPSDVLILDVRNQDEANAGMIKGAVLVPDEDLIARMAEVPKDKRIVTYCSTGVRAEMAYHKLKAAGRNAGFVYAEVEIDKDGNFKLKPKL